MKICHVASAHSRYDIRILEKECVSLARGGYEVYLLVNDNQSDEVYKSVHIVSTGFKPRNRRERIFKSIKYILARALEVDADVYHIHEPELFQLIKKLKVHGKKIIFDSHEDTELQILDKRWIPALLRKPVAKVYGMYSIKRMRMVDGVVTVTPALVDKFRSSNSNIVMITNYPILTEKRVVQVDHDSEEKYVFFAGGVSEQWCHEKIAMAVKTVECVKYVIAGRGDEAYIDTILGIQGSKIDYIGMIPHDEVEKKYAGAIAGMAVLECTQAGNEGTLGNTKLFEIMQAGKPVICSNLRLWKEIVEGNNCGICVDSQNIDSIADAIIYIANHPVSAKNMGDNGRRAVEKKYNWQHEENKLLKFYKNLIG